MKERERKKKKKLKDQELKDSAKKVNENEIHNENVEGISCSDKTAEEEAIKVAATKTKTDMDEQKAKAEEQKEKLYAEFREEDRINMALIEKEAHEAIAEGKAADLRRKENRRVARELAAAERLIRLKLESMRVGSVTSLLTNNQIRYSGILLQEDLYNETYLIIEQKEDI